MLTDRECRSARATERPRKLRDGHGLYLEVRTSGHKAWRYRYERTLEGRKRETVITLGDYATPPRAETAQQAQERRAAGHLTLREAREERQRLSDLRQRGLDPVEERDRERQRREQQRAHTLEQVCREWVELQDWQPRTRKRRLAMLERVVFPTVGHLPAADLQALQVLDVLKTAHAVNGPTVAAEAKRTLHAVYDHAVAHLSVPANPVSPIRRALPPHRSAHKRPLTPEEVGQFLRDLDTYERNLQTSSALQLMWLTLSRTNEIVGARWDEMDLARGLWRLPADRMKAGAPHTVPLPSQAIEILTRLKHLTGGSEHVFPHRNLSRQHMTTAAVRGAVRAIGWAGRTTPHATRVTGSTLLSEMGYRSDLVERQLAHRDPSAVRRTYNHAEHLPERAAMMQQWADLLDEWRAARTGKSQEAAGPETDLVAVVPVQRA